jgi:signal peptide peptidase SppA
MKFSDLRGGLLASSCQVCLIEERRGDQLLLLLTDLVRGHEVSDFRLVTALAGGGSKIPAALADLHRASDDDHGDDPRDMLAARLARPIIVPGSRGGKSTAVVSFRGMTFYDLEYQPYAVSTRLYAATINALAADESIGTIMTVFDTPGGYVTGVAEAADALFAAREKKKVVSVIDPLAASAGYYIASQGAEMVAVPSADVGAIGVYMLHLDFSKMLEEMGIKPTFIFAAKYKVEGNMFEPLGDEAKASMQADVDLIYAAFKKAVARGRGVSVSDVEANFGQGRCKMMPEAKKLGMVDRIETIENVMRRFGVIVGTEGAKGARADADHEPPSLTAADVAVVESTETDIADAPAQSAMTALDRMRRELDLAAH